MSKRTLAYKGRSTTSPCRNSSHVGEEALPDSQLSLLPIEPLETIELPAQPSVPGRLYRDGDSSAGDGDRLDSGQRDETSARLRALGISTPLHKRFPCVLPGHDHAARVHFTTAGFWQYHCDQLGRGVGLAEVRAFIAYGGERHLSKLEAARWRERLDYEAGLRYPIRLDVQLPEPCPKAAQIVAGEMRKFVGLRDSRFPAGESFVFADKFAQAYCGLTGDQIRSAKDWLKRAGVIHAVGKHGRAILWKLAAQDASPAYDRKAVER